jgi:hypothetical protein
LKQNESKELIELLRQQDPEKEVMIQQGEEYDYVAAYSVKEKDLVDVEDVIDNGMVAAVVIEYS